MALYRHRRGFFNQPSSSREDSFYMRVKIGRDSFEAEGPPGLVIQQFEIFRSMAGKDLSSLYRGTPDSVPLSANASPSPTLFRHLFHMDSGSSILRLRFIPEGRNPQAQAALFLLLGYKELRGTQEVPVLLLKQSLARSSLTVRRLDRVLIGYLKEKWILKAGRGKGGRYALTALGLKQMQDRAQELEALLPNSV